MSEPWEDAWEIHKHAAAEGAHIRWMEAKLSHGFADHPKFNSLACNHSQCDKKPDRHHPDMVPFADLSPGIQAYDYESAVVGFRLGFEAGVAAERARLAGEGT